MFSQSRKSTKLMQFMVRYLQIQRLHAKTFQQLYENNLKPHQPTKAILSVRVQNIKQTVVSDGRQNINKLFLICLHIQCFFCYKFSGKFSNHPKCRLSSERSSAIRRIWDTDNWYKKLGGNHNILVVVVVVVVQRFDPNQTLNKTIEDGGITVDFWIIKVYILPIEIPFGLTNPIPQICQFWENPNRPK